MALTDLSFLITAKDATASAFAAVRTQVTGLRAETAGLGTNVSSLGGGLNSLLTAGKAFAGAFAAQIGIEGLEKIGEAIASVVSEADDLQKTSERVGITTDALQELQYQANLTGASTDDLSGAMEKFGQNIGAAATGSGPLAKILAENNVSLKDAHGNMLPLLIDYKNYANLVQNATSQQQRLYLVQTAFGKGHDDLTNMLATGARGFSDSADAAQRFGDVLDPALVKRVSDVADDWERFSASESTITKKIVFNIVAAAADVAAPAIAALNSLPAPVLQSIISSLEANPVTFTTGLALSAVVAATAAPAPTTATPQGKFSAGSMLTGQQKNEAAARLTLNAQLTGQSPLDSSGAPLPGGEMMVTGKQSMFDGFNGGPATKTDTVADDAAAAAADALKKKVDGTVASLQQQNAALDLSGQKLAEYDALTKAGIDANNKMAPAVIKAADALYQHQQALQADKDAQKQFNDLVGLVGDVGYRAFDDLIEGAKSFKDVIKDDVIPALEEAVLQATLLGTGPLAGAFGTAPLGGKTTGGLLGSIGSAIVGAFTGPHAGGGFIPPGMWGTAGEDGPEPVYGGKTGMTVISNKGNGGHAQAPACVMGHIRLELASELLNARIVQVSGPLSLELFKSGQKDLRRQQGLAG